ncbi:hypothetical protein AQ876_13970 [Burkholderia pseudomallei]|nr:hypothetical protein AQ806_22180 [Burkholderia pseudomallei]ONA07524.1 hypothetical protein AQ876_13970 [Burkholderia pseudomallei]
MRLEANARHASRAGADSREGGGMRRDRRRAPGRRAMRYENESSRRIVSRSGRMKRFDSDA